MNPRKKQTAKFICLLLAVEFLDELIGGSLSAAMPLIRDDLRLNYAQIGILLSLPGIVGNIVEPCLFILGDTWKRKYIVLGGGMLFSAALIMIPFSYSFLPLLAAIVLFNPASGAFVGLSESTLMDIEPARHEQNMARWTFAGAFAMVAGPLSLTGALLAGMSWRGLFVVFFAFSLLLVTIGFWSPYPAANDSFRFSDLTGGLRDAWRALRDKKVLRWLLLLQFGDLMLDVFLGFLALYFVDVAGIKPVEAGIAVAIWTGVGLLGDFLLIPYVERYPGLPYLRISAWIELGAFTALLLVHPLWLKLALVGLLGLFNSGWYAILKARLFSSLPGKSGTVQALNTFTGLIGNTLPFVIGIAATFFGLKYAMWLLLLGPIALIAGLPKDKSIRIPCD
jgi:FSR family fosmidomycin resistance protein-like MFS transporter